MAENIANFVSSLLNGAITNSATSLDVDSATGFPSVNFRIVVQDSNVDQTNKEIMLVTGVSTNTFTVPRGQEGTTGVAHGDNSYVAHVLTATGLSQYIIDRAILQTIFAAKGDILGASANDVPAILTAGANGSSLVAASGESTGLKWRLHNDAASAAPTVNDDSGDGYGIGSRWIDTTNDIEYLCTDATAAAAVWRQTTPSVWINYTPTWTTSGTAPSLGNGTLTGRYKLLDEKTCLVHIAFAAGSTTTFGTGNFFFALPFTAASQGIQVMAGHILDSGTDNKIATAFISAAATKIDQIIPEGGNVVTNTIPMTWANGDQFNASGVYEIA